MARPTALRTGLFIAGTDTGVGKTTLGVALLRYAKNRGKQLIPFKPAETGCAPLPLDALRLWEAAAPPIPLERICLYALPLPAAPQAAAEQVGITISLPLILGRADDLGRSGDGLIVEGAGGLLVPYAADLTGADIAASLKLPVLLVARTALGTINHVALSVNEIRRRGLPLAGIVLVATGPGTEAHTPTNASLIEQLTGVRPLGTFPYNDSVDPEHLASSLARALGPDPLAQLGL